MLEQLTDTARATVDALMRDRTLWIAILSITLVFMVYLYLFPTAMEFFTDARIRSEPAPVQKRPLN